MTDRNEWIAERVAIILEGNTTRDEKEAIGQAVEAYEKMRANVEGVTSDCLQAEPLFAILPYPPSANRYWRSIGRGRVIVSEEAKRYRSEVARMLEGRASFGTAPVELSVRVWRPDKRKRDLSNTIKVLEDAICDGGTFEDDSQVQALHWYWGGKVVSGGMVELTVREAA